ncbi:MAG: hypothetical protein Q7U71_08390 [bacterium]|nr:hypothetical protein [bacterium]
MQQTTPNPQINKIILWAVAAEPLFLAGIAYFLNLQGAFGQPVTGAPEEIITTVFTLVSLVVAGLSFKFASLAGRPRPIPGQLPEPAIPAVVKPMQIISVALASIPGIFGFVMFILLRNEVHLLLFNGGALALAAWHIMSFENAR